MCDLISRQGAIEALKNQMSDCNDLYNIPVRRSIVILEQLPSAQPEKRYTKADYIMALHKEYGCDFVAAEKAHDMALEYLRSLSKMKG